ncbi:MAG: choline-sulfatase [Ectothiorhodospiraceae bacterium AqS1]|nr:choline-sulfatase [Ectothiorhodospiraceae bacterium AqS1]
MKAPNILILMVDQLSGTFFPDGPAPWLHCPNLRALADRSVRFANAYTASPLCAPARASFMTGMLPSANRVYDNAAEFACDIPTFAHHLRRAGYHTCLAGKMHFVGAEQLHGFEERLTTDIYPVDFGWTPDYRKPDERVDGWYHNLGSVRQAGVAQITTQLEYDDEVSWKAQRKIYDLARDQEASPWCLTVSFTHPHDPYVARPEYWELYASGDYPMPKVGPIAYEDQDPHSQRILDAVDWRSHSIEEEMVARARRAYFANISYLDENIGRLLRLLEDTGQEAITIFVADHGDMLGERGLWFKMSFYEGSARVPLMIAGANLPPGCISTPVSMVDIPSTLGELAGISKDESIPGVVGESLLPLIEGGRRTRPVLMEYAAEASHAPMVSIRKDRWKYNRCALDPDQLFDLESDPCERNNLAKGDNAPAALAQLQAMANEYWDLDRLDREVRESQHRRRIVNEALRKGRYHPWVYAPSDGASGRFVDSHLDLNALEEERRFPRA